MRKSKLVGLVYTILFISPAVAQESPLVSSMEVKKVVYLKDKNKEIYLPADSVKPGDTLEYILTYINNSEKDINNLEAIGPIPEGTVYIEESYRITQPAVFEASIDTGKTYSTPPVWYEVIEDNKPVQKKATTDMYTHLRWRLDVPLKPKEKLQVFYRVRVK